MSLRQDAFFWHDEYVKLAADLRKAHEALVAMWQFADAYATDANEVGNTRLAETVNSAISRHANTIDEARRAMGENV